MRERSKPCNRWCRVMMKRSGVFAMIIVGVVSTVAVQPGAADCTASSEAISVGDSTYVLLDSGTIFVYAESNDVDGLQRGGAPAVGFVSDWTNSGCPAGPDALLVSIPGPDVDELLDDFTAGLVCTPGVIDGESSEPDLEPTCVGTDGVNSGGSSSSESNKSEREFRCGAGWWANYHADMEFEGTSGVARGYLSCAGTEVECDISAEKIQCHIDHDSEKGPGVCGIEVKQSGDFKAAIKCYEPLDVEGIVGKAMEMLSDYAALRVTA